jgi:uncharacterized protein (DUF433 family)
MSYIHAMDNLLKRIVVNPKIMAGKPVISGTRITVEAILERLYGGMSEADIRNELPHLTTEDIKAAQLYALEIVRHEEVLIE